MVYQLNTFAVLKDTFGEYIQLEIDSPTSVAGLFSKLETEHPEHCSVWKRCRIAVNHQFVSKNTPVKESDVLFIMPPSSGG